MSVQLIYMRVAAQGFVVGAMTVGESSFSSYCQTATSSLFLICGLNLKS